MDRQIVYPGSIPLDTDLLNVQRNTMAALGSFARVVFGDTAVVDGLACQPASGFSVVIGPGSLSAAIPLDDSAYGSLPPDSTSTAKIGLSSDPVPLLLNPSPDPNVALCWLIQACLSEQDDFPVALPYWNAADPTVPFSGPGNSGGAQNTRRRTRVVFSTKSSGPVPIGTFAPPSPDLGWVGLYGVMVWAGKGGVTADDIHPIADSPVLPFHLPELAPGFSRQEVIGSDKSWQVPRGVRRIRVRLVGGGGGGGGGTLDFGGGGGGAGGYSESIMGVQPGQLFSVVVGTGGASGPPHSFGGTGGLSSFDNLVSATGGMGGGSSNPDSRGGGGGLGTAGDLGFLGGMGGDGPMIGGVPAGNGGVSIFGGGGRGSNGGGPPADGKAPGSGAGGGYGNNSSGGAGASGLVIVEF